MTKPAFVVHLTNAVGSHKSPLSIVISSIFVIISFFYVYTIASYFKVSISVLHNFYNYVGFFHFYIFSKYFDHLIITVGLSLWLAFALRKSKIKLAFVLIYGGLITAAVVSASDLVLDFLALLSVPLLVLLLALDRFAPKIRILNNNANTELNKNYIIFVGLLVVTAGLIFSFAHLFLGSDSITSHNYAYEVFILFSSLFSPLLLILLTFCIPVKLLSLRLMKKKDKANDGFSNGMRMGHTLDQTNVISRTKTALYLSFIIVLSIAMTLFSHYPTIDKDNRPIGADIQSYATAIKNLSDNPQGLIKGAFVKEPPFYGDRPISLLLFYGTAKLLHVSDPTYLIDYMPIIFGPALVLAIYCLTREITSNATISLLSAFMTAVSFQVLVGVYTGFYANWFALVIAYFSFVFLFIFLKRSTKSSFIIYFSLVILLALSHVYTWSVIAVVTVIFLLVMLKFKYYKRRNILLLLLVIISPGIIDLVRSGATGSISGISFSIQSASELGGGASVGGEFSPQLSLGQITSFRLNLIDSTEHFLGGLFGNLIILALGVYWLFRTNHLEPYNIFLMIFLSIGIVPLLFGNWVIQTRVFYNIPFQIPAGIALGYILQQKQAKGTLTLITICIWLIAISTIAVSNFYPILPQGRQMLQ